MARSASRQASIQFDRIAAVAAAMIIVGLVVFLLVRGEEIPGPRLFFALRVVLSLAAAVLGAAIPGFLEIGWKSGRDQSIRAGGALALFVLTFAFTPDLASEPAAVSAPGGVAAQRIEGGTFNIAPPATSQATKP